MIFETLYYNYNGISLDIFYIENEKYKFLFEIPVNKGDSILIVLEDYINHNNLNIKFNSLMQK